MLLFDLQARDEGRVSALRKKQHLHRYLAEFDFRFNHRIKLGYDDAARTRAKLLKNISGKRLMYNQPN